MRRPYFTLDAADVFRELGTIRNRVVEMSLSGPLIPQLDLVAGAVLLDPVVTGAAVSQGRVGSRPVDIPHLRADLNLDGRLPFVPSLSLDLSASYLARRPATTLDSVYMLAREAFDAQPQPSIEPATIRPTLSFHDRIAQRADIIMVQQHADLQFCDHFRPASLSCLHISATCIKWCHTILDHIQSALRAAHVFRLRSRLNLSLGHYRAQYRRAGSSPAAHRQ